MTEATATTVAETTVMIMNAAKICFIFRLLACYNYIYVCKAHMRLSL